MFLFLIHAALAFNFSDATAGVLATTAKQNNIQGQVQFKDGEMRLVDAHQQARPLTAGNENVSADLDALEDGDFVVGQGDFVNDRIVLHAIEFIGLRRLLGRWLDRDNNLIFDFQNFSNATIRSVTGVTQIQYALIPDQANRWTIFLGNQSAVVIGILTYYQKTVRIDLINSQTGAIEKTMRMQAIRP
ncbi:MAG TPA: hypothetical protein VFV50_03710 [Bdellovibrionales bacterium]|nr:hypothetical protein [Bdellovibrionales bacterium]